MKTSFPAIDVNESVRIIELTPAEMAYVGGGARDPIRNIDGGATDNADAGGGRF